MSTRPLGLSKKVHRYLLDVGMHEPDTLRRLREHTDSLPEHDMQIAPEEGAFLTMLVEISGARKCLEIGTFTGYSALAVASALPEDGSLICCDVSKEWTDVAQKYWGEAGLSDRIDLRIAPALDTLDDLIASGESGTFDFAFVDADKVEYVEYYERLIQLMRPGGIMLWDNVLWNGDVIRHSFRNPFIRGIRRFNQHVSTDDRVSISMIPVADGLTILRKR